MMVLLPAPDSYEVVVATFLKPDAIDKLEGFTVYGLKWPTNRSIIKALQNAAIAVRVIHREKPAVIVSSGAASAVPFFFVGKLLGRTKNVFVECIDRIELPTLTAKLVRPVTDIFISQWPSQLEGWENRIQLERSR